MRKEDLFELLQELRPEFDFHESENFIEDGMLDSFDVVSLVSELEEKLSIMIDGMDIVPDNFVSADSICSLIKKSGGDVK